MIIPAIRNVLSNWHFSVSLVVPTLSSEYLKLIRVRLFDTKMICALFDKELFVLEATSNVSFHRYTGAFTLLASQQAVFRSYHLSTLTTPIQPYIRWCIVAYWKINVHRTVIFLAIFLFSKILPIKCGSCYVLHLYCT